MRKSLSPDTPLLGWGLLTAWGLASLTLDTPPIPAGAAAMNAVTSLASIAGCALLMALARLPRRRGAQPPRRRGLLPLALAVVVSAFSGANQLLVATGASEVLAIGAQVLASLAYVGLMALAALLTSWYLSATRRIDLASLFAMLLPTASAELFLVALPLEGPATLGMRLATVG